MEPNAKFLSLLSILKDATSKGRIVWTDTVDEDTFRVILDRAAVRIGRKNDESSNRSIIVASLADAMGDTLESISTDDVNDKDTLSLLHGLYDMARNRVNKVDELLDRLITDVDSRRTMKDENAFRVGHRVRFKPSGEKGTIVEVLSHNGRSHTYSYKVDWDSGGPMKGEVWPNQLELDDWQPPDVRA